MGHTVLSPATLPPRIQLQAFKLGLGGREPPARPLRLAARPRFLRGWQPLRLKAVPRAVREEGLSPWDDKPYELLPGGRRSYLDEQDVVSFLNPPKEFIPIDPASYHPAAYLWKKIGDIPEERRHRLLSIVKGRLVSRCWELAGTRYQDAKLAKQNASALLTFENNSTALEFWNCRTSGGPLPVEWLNDFGKVIFHGKDGDTYGRIIIGGSIPFGLGKYYSPLYFKVTPLMEVMSTEQPCDVAYEFGNGLLDPWKIPAGFPKPAEHPWPFNDHLVIYVRHAGPGVMVGQAWQEGKELEQVPKKLCGEILMVKYFAAGGQWKEGCAESD
ncbi:unnamed protein product [Musa acuminata subsp. malaccensis]|uniref:(wild Malaysian banana) hypothetical protein n=1 Tax=Musa acuminata subsp. malaccensis TaxID=214687 RepID=A0A804I8H8_MUSAM|nr:PREDICTED: uncharacterized protein LOC103976900 [Musa acuminata subsp. malaccensis]CAG1849177.1 unnamed protein product [Musa acuminata subsp. malaccensis]